MEHQIFAIVIAGLMGFFGIGKRIDQFWRMSFLVFLIIISADCYVTMNNIAAIREMVATQQTTTVEEGEQ